MTNTDQMVINVLQQRIGQITSNYEMQIALLRAEITKMMEEMDARKKEAEEYSASLNNISN